jgi:hypothetical protein
MKKWHKPLFVLALAVSSIGLTASLFIRGASAATGQIYITPSSGTVQPGGNVTVTLRINPAADVNAVQATVNFDSSKLKFISDDSSASPFGAQIQHTQSGGSLSIAKVDLTGGGTSADSVIDVITFNAIANSGSADVTLTNANATLTANGNTTDPVLAGATINFVTPTCPSGQVGTPPNCSTPAPAGTGNNGPTPTGTSAAGSHTTMPTNGTTGGSSTSTSKSGASAATPPKITANSSYPQYSLATVSVTSDVPTRAYVKYGLSKDALLINSSVSDLGTTHTVSLDPANLIPGETYYYSVITTDTTGNVTQTAITSFKLKGLQLKVGVFDKNQKPLRNATVTLHSTPLTVKTDNKGYALLTDVTPGLHHLSYVSGGKIYSQEIQAVNNITTKAGTQGAPTQNFAVVYSFAQSSSNVLRYGLGIAALIITAVALILFIRRQRELVSQPLLVANPKVVSSSTGPLASVTSSSRVDTTDEARVRAEQLEQISGQMLPGPGSTVTPVAYPPKEDK